jgi:hypothetical protein
LNTRRLLALALAALGGGTIGCFSQHLTLGDQCTLDSDCGWDGECTEGFCGGCNVIDDDLYTCLCTVDLAWSNPAASYEGCFPKLFPAPQAPLCLSGRCVVMDEGIPRCNFAYATESANEKGHATSVSVAIPHCDSTSDGGLCFNVVDPISETCAATGSNVEVTFEYNKATLGAEIETLGVVCEVEQDDSKCPKGDMDSCNSVDLGNAPMVLETGDTSTADSTFRSTECGGEGPEAAFRWTAPSEGGPADWVIETTGSEFDTVLHVRSGTCEGPEIACDDDDEGGESVLPTSRVTVNLDNDEEVVIFVDAYFSTGGHFVLNISRAPEDPAPEDP